MIIFKELCTKGPCITCGKYRVQSNALARKYGGSFDQCEQSSGDNKVLPLRTAGD